MYLRILKKDLKRKKTMNIILLIFIILAATFIASSVNSMISISTALDSYFDKAGIPDYWFATSDANEFERYKTFAEDNNYSYTLSEFSQVDPSEVFIDGARFNYSNSVGLSTLDKSIKIFDSNDDVITHVNDGEIYLTAEIFYSDINDFEIGSEIEININNKSKTFTIKGCTKDAMFGSSMIGMTRFVISDSDYDYFRNYDSKVYYSVSTNTYDADYSRKLMDLEIITIFNIDRVMFKLMYIMDMIIAAVMLIISICLILISMVILRFTINFTMSEEFREIGVMKALGLKSSKIRGLYIVKYLTIAIVGASIGFVLSIPFGEMMLKNLSRNIIISNDSNILLNLICCVVTAAIVVIFCYMCTSKINKFSPINAIRNGQSGERFSRKSVLSLNKSKLSPVSFLALNDILSGLKKFIAMILIFTLGLLLIIIPANAINTLQSDNLLSWFNMADCDHVISNELFSLTPDNEMVLMDDIDNVKKILCENNIDADVFQEIMFRMTVTYDGKKTSSVAFQGIGDVTTDQYTYLEGSAPQNNNEVALTVKIADSIGARIGDKVEIKNGENTKKYIVTATFQSMNNTGEGIRFYQDDSLDYSYAAANFGIQIKYTDNPDKDTLAKRKALLKECFPEENVYNAGEYINFMIGDVAGQLGGIKQLILLVVICINILVTVLMVKSFITKEKGEIAMLKAIGFRNSSLVVWQSLRIGIVLFISTILATALSTPLSQLTVSPVFRMMGAQSIEFEIVHLEVYVLYPLTILCTTVLSGMLAALQLKKISASETSTIE